MKCPKCGSEETYRKNPGDLTVYCDRCGHSYTASQTQKPVSQKTIWKSKGELRGKHHIDVWLCPVDTAKYSFALRYGASLPLRWDEYSEDPYVKGCFDTQELAIVAGIEEIYSNDYQQFWGN